MGAACADGVQGLVCSVPDVLAAHLHHVGGDDAVVVLRGDRSCRYINARTHHWLEQQLPGHGDRLLVVLPTFAASDQWKKEGGKFHPEPEQVAGQWRMAECQHCQAGEHGRASGAGQANKAGLDAWARVETARKFGNQPEADDLTAVERWRAAS